MGILIAVVATFLITVLWQTWATRANKAPLKATIHLLTNELNGMARELEYANIEEYWKATKGVEYSKNAARNLTNALKSLE